MKFLLLYPLPKTSVRLPPRIVLTRCVREQVGPRLAELLATSLNDLAQMKRLIALLP